MQPEKMSCLFPLWIHECIFTVQATWRPSRQRAFFHACLSALCGLLRVLVCLHRGKTTGQQILTPKFCLSCLLVCTVWSVQGAVVLEHWQCQHTGHPDTKVHSCSLPVCVVRPAPAASVCLHNVSTSAKCSATTKFSCPVCLSALHESNESCIGGPQSKRLLFSPFLSALCDIPWTMLGLHSDISSRQDAFAPKFLLFSLLGCNVRPVLGACEVAQFHLWQSEHPHTKVLSFSMLVRTVCLPRLLVCLCNGATSSCKTNTPLFSVFPCWPAP